MKWLVFALAILLLLECKSGRDREAVVESIRNMTEMATVEYTVSKVVKHVDKKIYGTRKILFETEAKLKAGIDFKEINIKELTSDSIRLVIPEAKLISINMAPEFVEEKYVSVGLLRQSYEANEKEKILAKGEEDIRKNIKKIGVLKQAQKNAHSVLRSWLRMAGFKSILIEEKQKLKKNT